MVDPKAMKRKHTKTFLIGSLLTLFFLWGCTNQGSTGPKPWEKWKETLSKRHAETFAAPSITHHIYLNSDGDKAFLDLTGPYPRLVREKCSGCLYGVARRSSSEVVLTHLQSAKETLLSMEKPSSIQGLKTIYLAPYFYGETGEMRVFVHDLSQSQLSSKRNREFYSYDQKLLFQTRFSRLEKPLRVKIQRSDGSRKDIRKVAELKFEAQGKKNVLSIYQFSDDEKQDPVKRSMLLFRDYTNGKSTYGAGRFLNVEFPKELAKLRDGDLVEVDFNHSYNPPCAVSTGFHCPLPEDLLLFAVEGGEKYRRDRIHNGLKN